MIRKFRHTTPAALCTTLVLPSLIKAHYLFLTGYTSCTLAVKICSIYGDYPDTDSIFTMKLMITYDKLWDLLKARGISQYSLMKNFRISPSQINRIHHDSNLSTKTINTLCAILDCQPGDIMEYHPDSSDLDSVQKAAKKNR